MKLVNLKRLLACTNTERHVMRWAQCLALKPNCLIVEQNVVNSQRFRGLLPGSFQKLWALSVAVCLSVRLSVIRDEMAWRPDPRAEISGRYLSATRVTVVSRLWSVRPQPGWLAFWFSLTKVRRSSTSAAETCKNKVDPRSKEQFLFGHSHEWWITGIAPCYFAHMWNVGQIGFFCHIFRWSGFDKFVSVCPCVHLCSCETVAFCALW